MQSLVCTAGLANINFALVHLLAQCLLPAVANNICNPILLYGFACCDQLYLSWSIIFVVVDNICVDKNIYYCILMDLPAVANISINLSISWTKKRKKFLKRKGDSEVGKAARREAWVTA